MEKIGSNIFKGAATALITPFKSGKIDFFALGKLIDRQIDGGISALVICGTTGEVSTMSIEEQLAAVEFAVRHTKGRVPVIAGCGSNSTQKALFLTRSICRFGVDGLLVVTPYYNKASTEGLIAHFKAIADQATKPILLYNVPSRTGVNIPIEAYIQLSEHKNIVGVKEAGASISAVAEISAKCGSSLPVYSGNDDMILPVLSLGGLGVISVVSNILPAETSALCDAYFSGDTQKAKEIQLSLSELINTLFCQVNPIPVKYAMSLMGLCQSEIRLPLTEPCSESKARIRSVLKSYGLV